MELKEYIAPLRRWWWLILIATLIAGGVSYFAASRQPSQFRARTTLMIGRAIDNPNPSGSEFWLTQQLAQTYTEIAKRDPVRLGTMSSLSLDRLPDFSVQAVEQTQLIEISVIDEEPARAQSVANELARQLILQSPTSPELEDQSRKSFINEQLDGLEKDISATEEEISEKQDELANVFNARQITDLRTQISALQSKLTTLQANYANLLANTSQGAINTLSIIEESSLPTLPIGPNTFTIVALAVAIGFTMAIAAAYLLEYLDDSVATAEEVTRITGLATLAGIAKIDEADGANKLIAMTQPRSPTTEAYRVLRTGIQFSSVDRPDKGSLMVTSANPGEGKSVTVANLAIVMAQAGHNVLIVDGDLRRPVQHKLFGLRNNSGLTRLLLELDSDGSNNEILVSILRAVQPTAIDGLHILTSGPIPPNPSELLGSSKMQLAVSSVTDYFDYVIFDSPPVLAVTDATVLSQRTDGVLLVIDAGSTRKPQLEKAIEHLESGSAHMVGVLLNRLTPRTEGYDSYYYYRSSYYDDDQGAADSKDSSSSGRINSRLRRRKSGKVVSETG
jgi:succinoglycan biosynthesis transport protein ExoP